jgi:hypothetical protein
VTDIHYSPKPTKGNHIRHGRARKINTAYIVGAGFSWYAGLPLQEKFTSELLEPIKDKNNPDYALVRYLAEFIKAVFDHSRSAPAKYWPNLEDIFTCIDMAANTGHHLCFDFPPSRLRTVRRALLTRIITMLHNNYGRARDEDSFHWRQLRNFIRRVRVNDSAFISMNWDTVIEQRISELREIDNFDYRCRAVASDFPSNGQAVERLRARVGVALPVIKIHGSINWLYCDSCRGLYSFPAAQSATIASQLLSPEEWKQIDPAHVSGNHWCCSRCKGVSLGTRIATFSYLKALDFPLFQLSWFSAERVLRDAKRWVFIGYSLPSADYEFKYLLKRIQISRKVRPEIVLVTGGSHPDATYRNYQRFFGRVMDRKNGYFPRGLSKNAVERITE